MVVRTDKAVLRATADEVLIEARGYETVSDVPSDVFFWFEDGARKIAKIAWRDACNRTVNVKLEGITVVNADPLPNGIEAGQAILAGVILRDATEYRFSWPVRTSAKP
jgi:hypothetical protein